MKRLAPGISYLDLHFLGFERIIASAVLHLAGVAIIDPGPSTSLAALKRELGAGGLSLADVDSVILTHIHLDHAGATGTIVAENPGIRVYVHEAGAPHMASPQKLIASATRLYGGEMQRLWGEIRPVPQEAIVALKGGESLKVGGHTLQIAHTPGHAVHHISMLNPDSGIAFVGDTAGVRLFDGGYLLPPTPPPDIDIPLWRDSIKRIEAWGADTLFITHFGPQRGTEAYFRELEERLAFMVDLAQRSLERPEPDDGREAWFTDALRRELRKQMPRGTQDEIFAYEQAGRFDLNWRGLSRYLKRQGPKN